MALQMARYLEDKVFNLTLRGQAFTPPDPVYLALFTSAIDEVTGGTEVSGGDYERQEIAFDAPVDGTGANTSVVTFPSASADWGTISHWAIMDDLTSGNMLYYGEADTPRTVTTGNTITVVAGKISVAVD